MTGEEAIKWFEEAVPKNCSECSKEMNFSAGGWVTSCKHSDSLRCEAYFLARVALRELEERSKVVTQADRIRAMSDEELAEMLSEKLECSACPIDDCGGVGHWCKKALLKWLKQPVKEDA